MDREAVEDVIHASLGRHLRVTCVLGLLFLGVGFVLGHYVAAQHARELSDRWTDRAEELARQFVQDQGTLKVEFQAELAQVRELAQASHTSHRAELAQSARQEEMLSETQRLARATEDLRQSLITRCIEQNEREQARILQELQPYLDRKMTIQAAEVSNAVNRLVNTQVTQLKTLAQVEAPSQTVAANHALTLRSNISPVSAEADAALCPVPDYSPLAPVAEVTTPTAQEPVALMPMTMTPMVHLPVPAEPTTSPPAQPSSHAQFFTAPRKPRLFIPARKPLEISKAKEPVVR